MYSSSSNYIYHWERYKSSIDTITSKSNYPGHIRASTNFLEPYPRITYYEFLILSFIHLLEKYAYNIDSSYMKLTMGYTISLPSIQSLSYTLGPAIPLFDTFGNRVLKRSIYSKIEEIVRIQGEKYNEAVITGVFINIYYNEKSKFSLKSFKFPNISYSDMIRNIMNSFDSDLICGDLPEVKSLKYKLSRIPTKINKITLNKKECRPFIVADIETILLDKVNVPYAAGYLVVNPGDDLTSIPDSAIEIFFSESHIPFYPNFEDRSSKMFFSFLSHLEECVRDNNVLRTIYFHYFARFDGILILRYYADRGNKYRIKPKMRNHRLYELKVYIKDNIVLRFRDSCTLLPSSLASLGNTLCPELGPKGSIPHSDLVVSDLQVQSKE